MYSPYPLSINDSSLAVRSKVMSFPQKPTTRLTTEQGESTRVWQLQSDNIECFMDNSGYRALPDLVKALCSKYSCSNYFMPNPASPPLFTGVNSNKNLTIQVYLSVRFWKWKKFPRLIAKNKTKSYSESSILSK